jgi:hypothetical protein
MYNIKTHAFLADIYSNIVRTANIHNFVIVSNIWCGRQQDYQKLTNYRFANDDIMTNWESVLLYYCVTLCAF